MAIIENGANINGVRLQAKVTALTTAKNAAPAGSASAASLTKALAEANMELVLHLLSVGRIDPATVLSTLS